MNRYYTLMIVPEREKGVKSIRIPRIVFFSLGFLFSLLVLTIGVFLFNYVTILYEISDNRQLALENRQLREQIQVFQMKMNSLSDEIERIQVFEKKLKVMAGITGKNTKSFDESDLNLNPSSPGPIERGVRDEIREDRKRKEKASQTQRQSTSFLFRPYEHFFDETSLSTSARERSEPEISESLILDSSQMKEDPHYQELKQAYEEKIAANLGLVKGHGLTRHWTQMASRSFTLADSYAQLDYSYDLLKRNMDDVELALNNLDLLLMDRQSLMKSTPSLMPTRGWITSYYGPRISPYSGRRKMHEGIDIGARSGTPIIAPADGVILYAGLKSGLGNFVHIDHGYGIETVFGHAREVLVKKGQRVKRGKAIAKVGNTGLSTGPHLHYEVRVNGVAVDPIYFVLD